LRISLGTSVFLIVSALSATFVRNCSAVNMGISLHGNGTNALALGGAVMSGYWMVGSYMGTITSNCDAYYANNWLVIGDLALSGLGQWEPTLFRTNDQPPRGGTRR
jgi:hypothetical protein